MDIGRFLKYMMFLNSAGIGNLEKEAKYNI